jgi:hypothetical protein
MNLALGTTLWMPAPMRREQAELAQSVDPYAAGIGSGSALPAVGADPSLSGRIHTDSGVGRADAPADANCVKESPTDAENIRVKLGSDRSGSVGTQRQRTERLLNETPRLRAGEPAGVKQVAVGIERYRGNS